MPDPKMYKQFAVLYVDDELQSLKYFHKAFDNDFRVITAASAEDAIKILDSQGADLGILISDQRMPGKSGVDLLGRARQTRPAIVRMLTTAYSDTDSAIEAVNSGAIYKYVVKPWNIRDLRGVLLRAMDYFLVQRERDLLLREKLSVLQRIIVSDRVHSLAVLATGLAHHIRNSMTALTTFLDLTPVKLRQEVAAAALKNPEFWEDLWGMAQRESRQILQIVQRVAETTIEPSYSFSDTVRVSDLFDEAKNSAVEAGAKIDVAFSSELPSLKADLRMIQRLIRILTLKLIRLNPPGSGISMRAKDTIVWGAPGVEIELRGTGPDWDETQIASLFTAFAPAPDNPQDTGLDLLSAFFIVHHHGGDILIQKSLPNGFTICLPCDPQAAKRPTLEENCLEKLFLRFDREDSEIN